MAEALKDSFSIEKPQQIADMICAIYPSFAKQAFIAQCLQDYLPLSLTQRSALIADHLYRYLPNELHRALEIIVSSLGPRLDAEQGIGMAPFVYLPYVQFIAKYGLEYFDASMAAQYELTQRFTAEFSIRPFLEKYPEKTLSVLAKWTQDASPHVRRLVSEGTRPRLPWASRLPAFQADPEPVLRLLESLKDDPVLYVRRSVANNLNDISKDNPEQVALVATRWLKNASSERQWIVTHALRSAIKRNERWALEVLGYHGKPDVEITTISLLPLRLSIGEKLTVAFTLKNTSKKPMGLLVDFRIHYCKANGSTSGKVFKLKTATFLIGEEKTFRKTVSFADMTTRKHYAGDHRIEVIVNGVTIPLGSVQLIS